MSNWNAPQSSEPDEFAPELRRPLQPRHIRLDAAVGREDCDEFVADSAPCGLEPSDPVELLALEKRPRLQPWKVLPVGLLQRVRVFGFRLAMEKPQELADPLERGAAAAIFQFVEDGSVRRAVRAPFCGKRTPNRTPHHPRRGIVCAESFELRFELQRPRVGMHSTIRLAKLLQHCAVMQLRRGKIRLQLQRAGECLAGIVEPPKLAQSDAKIVRQHRVVRSKLRGSPGILRAVFEIAAAEGMSAEKCQRSRVLRRLVQQRSINRGGAVHVTAPGKHRGLPRQLG